MKPILVTNSRMTTFHACQRLHYYKYVQGYRTVEDAEALEFGTVMHAGLDVWWTPTGDSLVGQLEAALWEIANHLSKTQNLDPAMKAKAELLMIGYDARWSAAMEEYELVASEVPFRFKISGSNGLLAAGKIDKIVKRRSDGTFWSVEHKTKGSALSFDSIYWQRLRMDSQVSLYFDGAKSLGYELAGCIYDVIRKPDQRPLKATPVELRKYKKDGTLYASQRDVDETMDDFKIRMAEAIVADPDKFYARQEVLRLESELEAARLDTALTARQIRNCEKDWYRAPRNVDACLKFGGGHPCAFLDVCSGQGSVDDETRFKKLTDVHPELAT
jgi:hypothetical protein